MSFNRMMYTNEIFLPSTVITTCCTRHQNNKSNANNTPMNKPKTTILHSYRNQEYNTPSLTNLTFCYINSRNSATD